VSQREDRHRRPPGRERVRVLEGVLTQSPAPPVGATGGRRLRLRASIEPLLVENELYLIRAGADDLVIREPGDDDRALIEALAQEALTAGELAMRLGLGSDAVADKLDALASAGVLTPGTSSAPLDAEDGERFSRQLPYLAEHGDEHDLQCRLAGARITVLGCGGLGSWAIAALAAAGVRRFRLVDDDVVELSNLNRQAIYRPDQVGTAKVKAAAQWLRAFDGHIEVEARELRVDGLEAARRAVADADVVVLTADEPPYVLGRWVNTACLDAGVPFITAGQVPPLVRVGPLYMPGRTACFACHETALRSESIAYDRYVEHVQTSASRAATLGPTSAIAGSLLAMELMHLLIGSEPATAGAAFTLDIRTLQVSRTAVPRDGTCRACAGVR
jgi:bacteriocin biosynthesis cyclodehydratase domain-containing protein